MRSLADREVLGNHVQLHFVSELKRVRITEHSMSQQQKFLRLRVGRDVAHSAGLLAAGLPDHELQLSNNNRDCAPVDRCRRCESLSFSAFCCNSQAFLCWLLTSRKVCYMIILADLLSPRCGNTSPEHRRFRRHRQPRSLGTVARLQLC